MAVSGLKVSKELKCLHFNKRANMSKLLFYTKL